ncbi:hypothetical protein PA905_07540 [Planktothrix agardhii CCAP 1459/11A]|jgi:hypothetical protein|uniref:Uncharacterized protein n=1 Tax=Planktothrix agardhii CCAP 1459/11A TaxID=282420 RepID=A0A479ZTF5_PLAAG|nr:hypothetical protein [Planktothrix agardhii]GCL34541.1 hypothetical protein PA905_07540 [Planktothrix agardhii CCAP 1459/11A]CAD0225572.1 conserved hypothetical protein [Planktothrix agardhii]CAD5917424.1 hypothetical protein NO758_00432 [Planktothrix agardhii]
MSSPPDNCLLQPSLEQLLAEIVAINHAWKEARLMFGNSAGLTVSLRNLKTRSQVRLLRNYAPEKVYLKIDQEALEPSLEADNDAETGEPLYGLILRKPVNGVTDAAHIPVRVAQEFLSESEIKRFTQN